MSSSEAPICQCRKEVILKVQQSGLEANLNDICLQCRTSFLELANLLKANPNVSQKAPAVRTRGARKPRAQAAGKRLPENTPGASRGQMAGPRRAMHENYSQLYKREQELLQAVEELKNQMALRNQPLPSPSSIPRQSAPVQGQTHPSGKSSPTDPDVDMLPDTFGVEFFRNDSEVQFVGATATSEYILQECDGITITKKNAVAGPSSSGSRASRIARPQPEEKAVPFLKCFEKFPEIILLSLQFPNPSPRSGPADLRRFLFHIPEYEQTEQLINNYVTYVTWLTSPIPLSSIPEMLNLLYPDSDKCPIEHLDLRKGHILANLFAICLFGSYFDTSMADEERTTECAKYMTLARATLTCVPLSEHATVEGVQCMVLLMWYSRFAPSTSNTGYQWFCSGLLAKQVQSLGLHTDGRRGYNTLREDQIKRAEQSFWEYYMQDVFQSFVFGRPVALHPTFISCRKPEVEISGDHHPEFFPWKYSMTLIMTDIIESTVQSSAPAPYNVIRNFDRQIRRHGVPFGMEWPNSDREGKARDESIGRTFQRALGSTLTQTVLMILHRSYFWEAVSKRNQDLVQHRYWNSVVAAYHASSSLISSTLSLWNMYPSIVKKFAFFWSHCHSASMILGALVSLRPDSQFSQESLAHLDRACEMFQTDTEGTSHLASRFPALFRLQAKAREKYNAYIASTDSINTEPMVLTPSFSSMDESDSADNNSRSGQDDAMMLDVGPGVYRVQEEGWDHLILPS